MRTTFSTSLSTSNRSFVRGGQLVVACVLLVGVIVLAYGYFEQNNVGIFVGLAVILAGVLNDLVRILTHGNR